MITETMENGVYTAFDGDNVLLTIESLGNNIYKARNVDMEIMAEVVPLNEYQTSVNCLDYKRADKNGKYKKSIKLLNHYLKWFDYVLEEKGFVRKKKCADE